MEEQELEQRKALCFAGKRLAACQLSLGAAGNLSVCVDDNHYICTPTGSSMDNLDLETLSLVDGNCNLVSGKKATKEVKFHLAIYKANPKIKAIVHLHSTYATAYACLQGLDPSNAVKAITPYPIMRLGPVHVVPYYKPGSDAIAKYLSTIAMNTNAFLLSNHGLVVGGKNMEDAVNNAFELEETCKLYFITLNAKPRYLTNEEIQELKN